MSSAPPSQAEWERLKPILWELWRRKGNTTAEIRNVMKERHNFVASKSAFDRQFNDKWKWRKKLPANEWKAVQAHIGKRKRDGKTSEVRLNGLILEDYTKRAKRHHLNTLEQLQLQRSVQPLPPDVSIHTPTSVTITTPEMDKLPFALFLKSLKTISLSLQVPGSAYMTTRNTNIDNRSVSKMTTRPSYSVLRAQPSLENDLRSLEPLVSTFLQRDASASHVFMSLYEATNDFQDSNFYDKGDLEQFLQVIGESQDESILRTVLQVKGPTGEAFLLHLLEQIFLSDNLVAARVILPRVSHLINSSQPQVSREPQPSRGSGSRPRQLVNLIQSAKMAAIYSQIGGVLTVANRHIWPADGRRLYEAILDNDSVDETTLCLFDTRQLEEALRQSLQERNEILAGCIMRELMFRRWRPSPFFLFCCAKCGNDKCLDLILPISQNLHDTVHVQYYYSDGRSPLTCKATALQTAIFYRQWSCAEKLLDAGASVNVKGHTDLPSPLHLACYHSQWSLAHRLIASGAAVTEPWTSPIGSSLGKADLIPGGSISRIGASAGSGDIQLVETLLAAGADFNERSWCDLTPLSLALGARDTDIDMVQCLVAHGASLTYDGANGEQCSVLAWSVPEVAVLEACFSIKADDLDVLDERIGETPLTAAMSGDYHKHDLIKYYLAHGADPGYPRTDPGYDGKCHSPLEKALQSECPKCVVILQDHAVELDNIRAFKAAATVANFAWIEKALESLGGSGLHCTSADSMSAGTKWRHDISRSILPGYVLSWGDIVFLKPHLKDNPHEIFRRIDFKADCMTMRLLTNDFLHYAIPRNFLGVFKKLFDMGITNDDSCQGSSYACCGAERRPYNVDVHPSILYAAARSGSSEQVSLMLKSGASPDTPHIFRPPSNDNTENPDTAPSIDTEKTALSAAAERGVNSWSEDPASDELRNITIMRLLIEAGADAHRQATGRGGRTILQNAVQHQRLQAVRYLLKDACVSANEPYCPMDGFTSLQLAAASGNIAIAMELIEADAEVNAAACPIGGYTALVAASKYGRLDMVQLLLSAGADISRSDFGNLQFQDAIKAANEGHFAVIEHMLGKEREAVCGSTFDLGCGHGMTENDWARLIVEEDFDVAREDSSNFVIEEDLDSLIAEWFKS